MEGQAPGLLTSDSGRPTGPGDVDRRAWRVSLGVPRGGWHSDPVAETPVGPWAPVPVQGQGAAQEAGHHSLTVLGCQQAHTVLRGPQDVLLAGLLQLGAQHTYDFRHLRARACDQAGCGDAPGSPSTARAGAVGREVLRAQSPPRPAPGWGPRAVHVTKGKVASGLGMGGQTREDTFPLRLGQVSGRVCRQLPLQKPQVG